MVKRKTLAFLSQFFFLPWPTALCLSLCHGSVHSGRVCVEMEGCCGSGFDWHLGPRDFLCCFSQRKQDRWREKRRRTKKRVRAWETDRGMREREKAKYSDVIALHLSGRAIMDLHRPAASSLSGYDMMAEFWPRLAEPGCGEEEEEGRPGRAGQVALGHGLGAVDLSALIERMSLQRAGWAAPSAVTHRAECQDESRAWDCRITG